MNGEQVLAKGLIERIGMEGLFSNTRLRANTQ